MSLFKYFPFILKIDLMVAGNQPVKAMLILQSQKDMFKVLFSENTGA